MKIDIIGSKFSSKLTEFKNFGFDVNNIVEGQSILSLLSKPHETTMKELNTTDLNDITVAYRDLNKLLYPDLLKSDSEVIMIDLLSELNDIVEFEDSFYNLSSFNLLETKPDVDILRNIQKFRAIYRNLESFITLLQKYEKVIILKILPNDENKKQFINGLYKLIEERIDHKLILTVNHPLNEKLTAPIEVYNEVNQNLKKFSSDNYYNQLLFDEKLEDNILSVYINHIEEREYIYELYKDGRPFKKMSPTTSRYFEYQLTETGKYRVRVNLTDDSINSRFSLTYNYTLQSLAQSYSETFSYIEIPDKKNIWMLETVLSNGNFTGLIGDAYEYPDGFKGYPVYLKQEINSPFIKKEQLLSSTIEIISQMSENDFQNYCDKYAHQIKSTNKLMLDFLLFIQKNKKRNY
ncbi:hypothetical protein [Corticicoccus populi]|uniref:Uncharacterized protein n=1 Tax=Corticicoccus populi TaxID=1812821 RepID=A0ABW5WXE0_9STAP